MVSLVSLPRSTSPVADSVVTVAAAAVLAPRIPSTFVDVTVPIVAVP